MEMREDTVFQAFREIIRIPSVTGTEGEEQVCAFLEKMLGEYGIASERITRVPGRPNLLAEIRAEHPTEPPLVLISHVDVVPAEAEEWRRPPFSADLAESRVWGRGTVDTKHLTMMELYAFVHLKGHEVEMNRDVRFLATIDEEQGSEYGMGWVRQERPELFRGAVVINEGGGFPLRINGKNYVMLTVGEKAVCRGRLRTVETDDGSAMLKMAGGLRQIFGTEGALQAGNRATQEAMRAEAGTAEWDNPVGADIFGYSGQNSITMRNYRIGVKHGEHPAAAEAEVDFKVLPGAVREEVEAYLRDSLKGTEVQWEVLSWEESVESGAADPHLQEFIGMLTEACSRNGFEGGVMPMLALGRTDGRFFAGMDSAVYGCSPLLMGDSFDAILPRVHGKDENILETSFRFGCRVLDEVIARTAGI